MSGSIYSQFMRAFIEYIPGDYDKSVRLTGGSKGELLEGWNPTTRKWEFNSKEEWDNIEQRKGAPLDTNKKTEMQHLQGMDLSSLEYPEFNEDGSSTGRTKTVNMGNFTLDKTLQKDDRRRVHVQEKNTDFGEGLEEQQLVTERFALKQLREKMTETVNKRFDIHAKKDKDSLKGTDYSESVAKGVVNHCEMAEKLTDLLKDTGDGFNPEDLFIKDGLLCRIKGNTEGQGGFADPKPQEVIQEITQAAGRLKQGKGTGDDANRITQFIAAFVDGLTEVIEQKPLATGQFEKVWKKFQTAFELEDDDKEKLLERVEGYKKLAGGMADTLSGKGTRKDLTRGGFMPNDSRYKIEDEDALIKGDISGSMHSQLLAQELSSTLLGGKGPKIKDPGESVQITDTGLLNARAQDALLLTAGGRDDKGDNVFHTAYEMINGMRKISGCPKVSQQQANNIIVMLRGGYSFTAAMEETFPSPEDGKLPWRDGV
jgi:hypothetical protein